MNASIARFHVRILSALAACVLLATASLANAATRSNVDSPAAAAPAANVDSPVNGGSPAKAASAVNTAVGTVTVLEINGAIGPATSRYGVRGIDTARASGSRVVVLQIDTPGGLDNSMRDIIRAILASSVPVVSYVAPSGSRAASAGTYILYASHIAAMAPATNLGAATPVSIGGGESPSSPISTPTPAPEPTSSPASMPPGKSTTPDEHHGDGTRKSDGEASPSVGPNAPAAPTSPMERKVLNDAVAYIRGLAELRGRNADWAEQAVRGAASLSATAALRQHVIDIVARDLPDLLSQLDGREVRIGNSTVKLASRELAVNYLKPDWRVELLSVITNPTIAYGLLLIGLYGLLFEGYNPGAVLPGVVGAICLLVALFAFQILSVNYAGLALLAVGVGMIVAEFFFPAFGSLGLGGLIAFVLGSLILFDTDKPGMNIGLPVIAAVATAGGLVIVALGWVAGRSLRRPVVTGVQAMVGEDGEVLEPFSGRGRVRYGGEIWNARSSASLETGQRVRITKVDGLTIWVEPV